MAEPYVREFSINGKTITSVVLDKDQFDAFADGLLGLIVANAGKENEVRCDQAQVDTIKRAGQLPLMGRGTLTEKFFTQFGVKTDLMGVVVRGTARKLLGF
jgi:hypothetical protein